MVVVECEGQGQVQGHLGCWGCMKLKREWRNGLGGGRREVLCNRRWSGEVECGDAGTNSKGRMAEGCSGLWCGGVVEGVWVCG